MSKSAQQAPQWNPKYRNKDGLNTEDRITRARIKLLTSYPFFGSLALYLDLVSDPKCNTAYTDGKVIGFNPDFIDSLEDAEINWVVCHEVLHPALGHLWRRGTRQHKKFNFAADYAIHDIMQEMARNHPQDFKMPTFCLYDEKYHEMSAEEIYDKLPEDEGEDNSIYTNGGVPGQGTLDDHDHWEDNQGSAADAQAQEEDWKGRVVSAAQQTESKNQGSMPASLKRLIGSLTKPQKNWKQLLAEFVQFEVHDYAFSPCDRRLFGLGDIYGTDILLPDYSEETEIVKELIFAIDTSGSIGNNELKVFLSEGVGLLNQFSRNVTGKVLYCDAAVQAIYDLDEIDRRPPKGGGGTAFAPVFDWVKKYEDDNGIEVSGVVYLTDLYGSFPKQAPHYPVLWVSTTPLKDLSSHYTPPFGQLTEIVIK